LGICSKRLIIETTTAAAAAETRRSSIDKIVVSRSSIPTTRRRQPRPARLASPRPIVRGSLALRTQYVVDLLFAAAAAALVDIASG